MTTEDKRSGNSLQFPVARVEAPTITLPNGASAEVTVEVPLNMVVKNIAVRTGDATNAITYTLKIYDSNSTLCFTAIAAIADNTKTMLHSGLAAPDFPEFAINGTCTVGITPSGDPGGSGVDVNVDLYGG